MLGKFFSRKLEILHSLNPKRVYVENVRHFLGVNEKIARWLCEKAARDGFFEKWISYEHPVHGHILAETPADQPLDRDTYHCDVSEANEEKSDFSISELKQRVFYRAPLHE